MAAGKKIYAIMQNVRPSLNHSLNIEWYIFFLKDNVATVARYIYLTMKQNICEKMKPIAFIILFFVTEEKYFADLPK